MIARDRADVAGSVARILESLGDGPVFVHSDPFRAARVIEPTRDRRELLNRHVTLIQSAAGERAVWMPAFNYDFPKTRIFRVADDPCQLGPLPEQFRTESAEWRTPIPIFSVTGLDRMPEIKWGNLTDPFGSDSIFAELVKRNGVILYYGETFHYNTIVHFSERQAGGPAYRYDKIFRGIVVEPNEVDVEGSLKYHVRPLGKGLEYDWDGLLARALDERVVVPLDSHREILAASAGSLNEFFIERIRRDPLGLLNGETREWVEPALNELGRRFELSDFESAEPAGAAALQR